MTLCQQRCEPFAVARTKTIHIGGGGKTAAGIKRAQQATPKETPPAAIAVFADDVVHRRRLILATRRLFDILAWCDGVRWGGNVQHHLFVLRRKTKKTPYSGRNERVRPFRDDDICHDEKPTPSCSGSISEWGPARRYSVLPGHRPPAGMVYLGARWGNKYKPSASSITIG